MRLWITLAAAMLLAACASYSGARLQPGEARLEDVQAAMGPPAMRWQDADGSVELAYPRGPAGYHTYMVRLAPDGHLQSIANVLEEESFARIRPAMTKDEVLRALGPPDFSRSVYFRARDELVWDWRFCQVQGYAGHLLVLFDGASGTVRSSMIQREHFGRGRADVSCSR